MPTLPDSLWVDVLKHVAVEHRLGSCCIVSQSFRTAATAATEALHVNLKNDSERTEAVVHWIDGHGSSLTSLQLEHGELQQLPCGKLKGLQQLTLSFMHAQTGPSSGLPAILKACTTVTKLNMQHCTLMGVPGRLDAVSQLANLQELELCEIWRLDDEQATLPISSLQPLHQLTSLAVSSNYNVTLQGLQGISTLTHLQRLSLCFSDDPLHVSLTPSGTPGFSLPPNLLDIALYDCELEVDFLAGLTNLTNLTLVQVKLEHGAKGAGKLLGLMQGMHHLESFDLEILTPMPPLSPDYGALTASSKLQRIDLPNWRLPEGVWQYMFAPQKRLPHLELLDTVDVCAGHDTPGFEAPPHWTLSDLTHVVRCCPALEELGMRLDGSAGCHVSVLAQLATLTRLRVRCDHTGNGEAMANTVHGLAALTNLKSLDFSVRGGMLGLGALLRLTALRQLWNLSCSCQAAGAHQQLVHLGNKAGYSGTHPNVWLQLLEVCAGDADCQPGLFRYLAQQLDDQASFIAQQRQHLDSVQEQAYKQQQMVARLTQRLAAAEATAEAARSEAADMRMLLAALHGQMDKLMERVL